MERWKQKEERAVKDSVLESLARVMKGRNVSMEVGKKRPKESYPLVDLDAWIRDMDVE